MLKHLKKFKAAFDFVKFAGFLVATISWITSTAGFSALLLSSDVVNKTALGQTGAWVAAGLICFIVQGLVVAMILKLAAGEHDKSRRREMYFILCIGLFLSIMTSYGSWWYTLSASDYVKRVTESRVEVAAKPIREAIVTFGSAAASFAYVAEHTSDMAKLEDAQGTSCGYKAGDGRGARYELRMEQNRKATSLNDRFLQLKTNLNASVSGLNSLNEEQMATAYAAARSVLEDPALKVASNWMQNQKTAFESGFTSDSGQLFACKDTQMLAYLDDSLAQLLELPRLDSSPPRVPDIDHRTAMMKSYARILTLIIPGSTEDSDGASATAQDFMPLIWPLFFETIMTVLLRMSVPKSQSNGGPLNHDRMSQLDMAPSDSFVRLIEYVQQSQGDTKVYDMMQNAIIEVPHHNEAILAVPIISRAGRKKALKIKAMLLALMNEKQEASFLSPVYQRLPVTDLPIDFQERVSWYSDKEKVDLYRIPNGVLHTLKSEVLLFSARDAT